MNTARREVRKALPGEAAALSTLAQRSKAHWGYSPEFMRACQAELTYNCQEIVDYPFYVLHSGARLIGFYALRPRSAAQVELEALFVEPEFIGTGCGRALIAHAKTTAAALGFRELIVQGDPNAVAFYEAAGGTPIGSRESASVAGRSLPLFCIALRVADHFQRGIACPKA